MYAVLGNLSLEHQRHEGEAWRDTISHTSSLCSFWFEGSFCYCGRDKFYMLMYRATRALLPPSRKSCYITIRLPSPYPFPYPRLPKRRGPETQEMLFLSHLIPKSSVTISFVKNGFIMDKCASCRCHGTSLRRIGGFFFLRKCKYPSLPRILDMVKRLFFCTLSRIRDVF